MDPQKLSELIDKASDGSITEEEEIQLLQAIKEGANNLSRGIDVLKKRYES